MSHDELIERLEADAKMWDETSDRHKDRMKTAAALRELQAERDAEAESNRLLQDRIARLVDSHQDDATRVAKRIGRIDPENPTHMAALKDAMAALGYSEYLEQERDALEQQVEALKAENERLRDGLVRIMKAWDGDSESMHDDPAVIARATLAGDKQA